MSTQQDEAEKAFYEAIWHFWHDVAPYPQNMIGGGMDTYSREARDHMFETRANLALAGVDAERIRYIEDTAKGQAHRDLITERQNA